LTRVLCGCRCALKKLIGVSIFGLNPK